MNAPQEHDPLMELVAQLDPLHQRAESTITKHKEDVFAQVDREAVAAPSRLEIARRAEGSERRGSRVLVGAIAAALIMLAGTLLLGLFGGPSTQAELIAAAERTATFDSGRVEVAVDLAEPVEQSGDEFRLAYSFASGDYRLDLLVDGAAAVSEMSVDGTSYAGDRFPRIQVGDTSDDDLGVDLESSDHESVDSSQFMLRAAPSVSADLQFDIQGAGQSSFAWLAGAAALPFEIVESPLRWTVNDAGFQSDLLPAISTVDIRSDSVVQLIRLTNNYEVTRTADIDIYRGTISRADLLAQDGLPAGAAILTSRVSLASELPETITFQALVGDDLIRELQLIVDGATVTTTYSEYGQAQNLSAPVVDDERLPDITVDANGPAPPF